MKAEKKLGKRTVDNGVETQRVDALEDSLDLQFPLRYELRGRTVGAFVLSRDPELKKVRFVFGFECRGVHSTLKANQEEATFDAIEAGLKDLPNGERLTIHMGSFSSDASRQQDLTSLLNQTGNARLKYLMMGRKHRVQELTRQGLRKPKFLRLYCTYTIDPQAEGATDSAERLVGQLLNQFHQFTGQLPEMQEQKFEAVFTRAFTDGFQQWEQLLSNKMGLTIRPLLETELWEHACSRFSDQPAPPLPQVVTLTESGLSETIHSDLHPTTLVIGKQEDCPFPDRAWVKAKKRFVGALTFVHKPAGWTSKFDQLRYLWSDIISRDQVTDTEIFAEFTRANEGLARTNLQRLTKQSLVSSSLASSKLSVDVGANIKAKRAVAAQEELYEGAVPLYTAIVILVHRHSTARLEEACRYIESCVRRPAVMEREREYAWLLWLQTLPITWDGLLAKPFNRRMVYLSKEAPGFMPLIRPRDVDPSGFELISEEGGVPLYLDLFKQHRHLGVFATTRAGKSVMLAELLSQALCCHIPIVLLDFPTDGSSTFKDYVDFLGPETGAYFDIGKESNNLLEPPDLRGMPLKQQQDRMLEFYAFVEGALLMMVMGSQVGSDSVKEKREVRAALALIIKRFFEDPLIARRYEQAFESGFGTEDWQQMPTLHDFYGFCKVENLGLYEAEADIATSDKAVDAIGTIRMQLSFWLTSRVGQSISAPSSFKTDVPLMVFALRNLNEDDDAAVLSLSAYSVALRNALRSRESIFFIDESPILFGFPAIAALVARLCANGAKGGVRVIISAQDPDTIAKSEAGTRVLQNLSTRLIGRIQPNAVPSFVEYFRYPEEIVSRCSNEAFFPKPEGMYSQWLLDEGDRYTYCRFYASYPQLAVTANNPVEQRARTAWMSAYDDPLEGLAYFTREFVSARRDGRDLRHPTPSLAAAVA